MIRMCGRRRGCVARRFVLLNLGLAFDDAIVPFTSKYGLDPLFHGFSTFVERLVFNSAFLHGSTGAGNHWRGRSCLVVQR